MDGNGPVNRENRNCAGVSRSFPRGWLTKLKIRSKVLVNDRLWLGAKPPSEDYGFRFDRRIPFVFRRVARRVVNLVQEPGEDLWDKKALSRQN